MSEHSNQLEGTLPAESAAVAGVGSETADKPSRRETLLAMSGAAAATLAVGCGGTAPMGMTQCLSDPPATALIVTPQEQAELDKSNGANIGGTIIYVTKDEKGYMAIDSRCQHAGCLTALDKATDGSIVGFVCGCHGSRYAIDGKVKMGPTVKPLIHVTMCRRASDNALAIDLQKPLTGLDTRVT